MLFPAASAAVTVAHAATRIALASASASAWLVQATRSHMQARRVALREPRAGVGGARARGPTRPARTNWRPRALLLISAPAATRSARVLHAVAKAPSVRIVSAARLHSACASPAPGGAPTTRRAPSAALAAAST